MERKDLEKKLRELQEENRKLKQIKKLQDTQIIKLIQELQESEKNLDTISLFSSIYETNSKYNDINTNLEISLTDIASNLGAKGVILFKKDEDDEFKATSASISYISDNSHKKDEDIMMLMQALDLRSEFPDIIRELEILNSYGKNSITLTNVGDTCFLCKKTNVSTLTLVQIIIDKEVKYLLAIINPKNEIDKSLLELISVAYSDTLKRIEQENQTHTLSITDNMTGVYNRRYYNSIKDSIQKHGASSIGIIIADLFRLKFVNDTYGHEAGDIYIKAMSNLLIKYFKNDRIFRLGGDEFLIMVIDKDYKYIDDRIKALEEEIRTTELIDNYGNKIFAHLDIGIEYAYGDFDYTELVHKADLKMNENKNEFYRSSGINRRK